MKSLSLVLIMMISVIGPSTVIAMVGSEAIKGLARNPYSSGKISIAMLLSFIFAEFIAIISLLAVWNVPNMSATTLVLVMFISTLGPSFGIAFVGAQSVRGLSRNPYAVGRIMTMMILSFIFAEFISLISLGTIVSMVKMR